MAEKQVRDRQRKIAEHGAALKQDIHHQLSSPLALLLAAGAGFATDRLVARAGSHQDSDPAASGSSNGKGVSYRKLFAQGLSLFTLVRSVAAMIQPAAQESAAQPQESRQTQDSGDPRPAQM